MDTPSQGNVGNDSISGEVGQGANGVAVGSGIEQSRTDPRAYGGSVYIVGRDGSEQEMASAGYILALLEGIDRRTGRLEQTLVQTAMDQVTARSERVAMQSELSEIRMMVQKIQLERENERAMAAARMVRIQAILVILLLVTIIAFVLHFTLTGDPSTPVAALLGYEAWRNWSAVGRVQ